MIVADRIASNLIDNLPTSIPKELIEAIVANQHVRIERIISHESQRAGKPILEINHEK